MWVLSCWDLHSDRHVELLRYSSITKLKFKQDVLLIIMRKYVVRHLSLQGLYLWIDAITPLL